MLLKISQDDNDRFVPANERTEHFFRFLGKDYLTLSQLSNLLDEKIEIQLDIEGAEPATSKLQTATYETKYLMWYNKHIKIWQGLKEKGTKLKLFSYPVYQAKSRSDLTEKMFAKQFAQTKEDQQ